MAIIVRKVNEKNWRVGSKLVYEDIEGTLIAKTELTTQEKEAFYNFLGKTYPKRNKLVKNKMNEH